MKIKKSKGTKKCVIKRKLKFEDYKNCLKSAQIENKINHLERNKIDLDSLYYKKEHDPNWGEIPGHPYKILIVGCFGSGKTNTLLNLINHQPDIDKIYLYAKDPYEAKYQLLINKSESAVLKYFNDSAAFIEYSNDMDDI